MKSHSARAAIMNLDETSVRGETSWTITLTNKNTPAKSRDNNASWPQSAATILSCFCMFDRPKLA